MAAKSRGADFLMLTRSTEPSVFQQAGYTDDGDVLSVLIATWSRVDGSIATGDQYDGVPDEACASADADTDATAYWRPPNHANLPPVSKQNRPNQKNPASLSRRPDFGNYCVATAYSNTWAPSLRVIFSILSLIKAGTPFSYGTCTSPWMRGNAYL